MKRCIRKRQKKNKITNPNWLVYLFFGLVSGISGLVLVILVGIKTIDWNWLTGYFLGLGAAIIASYLSLNAIKLLLKNENYFLYYFFYILRLGIYATPFLLGFLIPSVPFFWGGILIGLIPVLFVPFFQEGAKKLSNQFDDKKLE